MLKQIRRTSLAVLSLTVAITFAVRAQPPESGQVNSPSPTAPPGPTPTPSSSDGKPDGLICLAPPQNAQAVYIGNDIYTLSASQTATRLTIPGASVAFNVQIQNDGLSTRSLTVKLPATPAGWSVSLLDALSNGTDITQNAQGQTGWASAALAPGATKELHLELKPSLQANSNASIALLVEDDSHTNTDQVQAKATLQSVASMEFSLDAGKTWTAVPSSGVEVAQWNVLGLRALRSHPDLPWPTEPFKPTWQRGLNTHFGQSVWLYFPNLTPAGGDGEDVTVACGNRLSCRVRVHS